MSQIIKEYSSERPNLSNDSDCILGAKSNSYFMDINGTNYHVSVASSENAAKAYVDLIKEQILNELCGLRLCDE